MIDNLRILAALLLPLPMEIIAVKLVDVLLAICLLVLSHEEPDLRLPARTIDACIQVTVIGSEDPTKFFTRIDLSTSELMIRLHFYQRVQLPSGLAEGRFGRIEPLARALVTQPKCSIYIPL
jgi:hypothetical protein